MTSEQARALAATVKAEHAVRHDDEGRELLCCRICWELNPCTVFRLAEAVETLTAREQQLSQALLGAAYALHTGSVVDLAQYVEGCRALAEDRAPEVSGG